MATFTFPVTLTFIASIEAEYEGEALMTVQRELNEILADESGKQIEADNGVTMALVSGQIGDAPEAPSLSLENMAREMLCTACGRVSEECSEEPCEAVIADREEGEEAPCPINRRPVSTCPDGCAHGEA